MLVDLLYFGAIRDALGRDTERVDTPSHVLTVEDLVGWLRGRSEAHGAALAGTVLAAVEGSRAEGGDTIFGGARGRLVPADGRPVIDVRIQAADFDPGRQLERLGELNQAAVASYTGLVEPAPELETVLVEHYPALARAELGRLADDAEARWSLAGVVLIHRHGRFAPGDRLAFAAVAAGDAESALAACAFLAEGLRTRAPFWRKELLAGGSSRWR